MAGLRIPLWVWRFFSFAGKVRGREHKLAKIVGIMNRHIPQRFKIRILTFAATLSRLENLNLILFIVDVTDGIEI